MNIRTLALASILLVPPAVIAGEAADADPYDPPVRDGWADYPLGSWVEFEVTHETVPTEAEGGGETAGKHADADTGGRHDVAGGTAAGAEETATEGGTGGPADAPTEAEEDFGPKRRREMVSTIDGDGDVRIEVEDADGSTRNRMHVHGGTPTDLGLEKVADETVELTIDGETHGCRKRVYRNADDGRSDVLDRPIPDLLRGVGKGEGKGKFMELVLWEMEGVEVPYRELATSGLDFALGPRVVKARWTKREGEKEILHERTIVDLDATVAVGDRELPCHVEKLTSHGAGGESHSRIWLNAEVPGQMVRRTAEGENDTGTWRRDERVTDFAVAEPFAPRDWSEVPADERPVAGFGDFEGMAAGSWMLGISVYGTAEARQPDLVLRRLEAVSADGDLVTSTEGIIGLSRNQEKSYGYHRIDSSDEELHEREDHAEEREETVEICGERMRCTVRRFRDEDSSDAVTDTVAYFPVEERHRSMLPESDDPVKTVRTYTYETDYQDIELVTVEELDGVEVPFAVGDRELECWRFRKVETETSDGRTYQPSITLSIHHPDVPGGKWAGHRSQTGSADHNWSMVAAWGGADDLPPRDIPGTILHALERLGYQPFRHRTFIGEPIGASVDYAVTVESGGQEQRTDIRWRVEAVDWFGLPTVGSWTPDQNGSWVRTQNVDGQPALSARGMGLELDGEEEEELAIGDRAIPCRRLQYSGSYDGVDFAIVEWRTDERIDGIPYREANFGSVRLAIEPEVIRTRIEITQEQAGEVAIDARLTELDVQAVTAIGPFTGCVREEVKTQVSANGQFVSRTTGNLYHREVPGARLEVEETVRVQGQKQVTRAEIKDFHRPEEDAPPAAVACAHPLWRDCGPGAHLEMVAWPRTSYQDGEVELRTDLVAIDGGGIPLLRSEDRTIETRGFPRRQALRFHRLGDLAVEEDGMPVEEEITVAGKVVKARKRTLYFADYDAMIRLWEVPGHEGPDYPLEMLSMPELIIPGNVVRCIVQEAVGESVHQAERELLATEVETEVGDRTLVCERDRLERNLTQDQQILATEIHVRNLNAEVPGNVARAIQLDNQTEEELHGWRVVAFGPGEAVPESAGAVATPPALP